MIEFLALSNTEESLRCRISVAEWVIVEVVLRLLPAPLPPSPAPPSPPTHATVLGVKGTIARLANGGGVAVLKVLPPSHHGGGRRGQRQRGRGGATGNGERQPRWPQAAEGEAADGVKPPWEMQCQSALARRRCSTTAMRLKILSTTLAVVSATPPPEARVSFVEGRPHDAVQRAGCVVVLPLFGVGSSWLPHVTASSISASNASLCGCMSIPAGGAVIIISCCVNSWRRSEGSAASST